MPNIPKKVVKAYKLFRTDEKSPGSIFPLFVDAKTPVPVGEWVDAKIGEATKAPRKSKKGSGEESVRVNSTLGPLAMRPGWHAGDLPASQHIGGVSGKNPGKKPDYRKANQIWAEVLMPDDVDWQTEALARAARDKKGDIVPKTAHITDQVPAGGHYRYKTNPNMDGNWLIGGSMMVNRILDDDEVRLINEAAGKADLPRYEPLPKSHPVMKAQKKQKGSADVGLLGGMAGLSLLPASGYDSTVESPVNPRIAGMADYLSRLSARVPAVNAAVPVEDMANLARKIGYGDPRTFSDYFNANPF